MPVEQAGKNICFSGGAEGADTLFGKMADKAGHRVCHYGFHGHLTDCPFHWILTGSQLQKADPFLEKANETLKRGSFANYTPYVKNLLRRNWFQVNNSDSLYAVANINHEDNTVEGGTGWAVQMAIDGNVPLIYVFDQALTQWTMWSRVFQHFSLVTPPPIPQGLYAGIGTRTLTDSGAEAIIQLYKE